MLNFLKKVAFIAPFAIASPALAVSDADGIIGALVFTGLTANVASVVSQAFPVAAPAAGIVLGLAFLRWTVTTVGSAIGRRRA